MTPPPASAAAARTAPAVRPRRAPPAPVRRPRRMSGPAPARRAVNPAPAVATQRLFDRLIHGRSWIAIIAFALIGIVTMQLGLLKLNAGIGRALEHEAALQREDSALSVENSEVAAGNTVELQAAHMGMQLIPAGALRFLSTPGSGGEVGVVARAAAAAQAPASSPTPASTEASTSTEAVSPTTEATTTTAATTSSAAAQTAESTTAGSATAPSTSVPSTEAPAVSEGSTSAPASTPTTAPTAESGGASASSGG